MRLSTVRRQCPDPERLLERMARKLTQRYHAFKAPPGKRCGWLQGGWLALIVVLLVGCTEQAWNNPYRAGEAAGPVFFSSFSERPKHLDPARSYSANEWAFISQVYEPPLQYHFLRRPYALVPLTAASMPEIRHYGHNGTLLAEDADPGDVAYTDYILTIRPGIRYQPHPAFALGDDWPAGGHPSFSPDGRYLAVDYPRDR